MTPKKPVLLIDDNDNDTFLFQRAWNRAGIENPLKIVRTRPEAIEHLETTEPDLLPCVVVTDLRLQDHEGFTLLQWIRSRPKLKTLIVVVLTGQVYSADVDRAYHLGANSFVCKSSDPGQFSDLVRLIAEYWLRANVSPPQCDGKEA